MSTGSLQDSLRAVGLNAFRIVFGLMFMQHGAQKLLAMFGREEAVPLLSQAGLAGALELGGGLLIAVGLATRPVAFVLSGEMAWAFFQAHLPRGWVPIMNGGELAVLYCFAFFLLAFQGGGAFSLDGLWARRKKGTAS